MKFWWNNLKAHPIDHLVHLGVGVFAAWLGPVEGAVVMGGFGAYQFGSWLRKSDTVGIDCAYAVVGYGAFAAIP